MSSRRRSWRRLAVLCAVIAATVAVTPPARAATPVTANSSAGVNSLAGARFFVMPGNPAQRAAATTRAYSSTLNQIAAQPTAYWIVPQKPDYLNQRYVNAIQTAATAAGQVPVFTLYAITNRDCGSYSSGGEPNAGAYRSLVNYVRAGIAGRRAVVIVEPDAIVAAPTCLDSGQMMERAALLRYAANTLSRPGTSVYLDAGNWNSKGTPQQSLAYLMYALPYVGIDKVAGFALDTSGVLTTKDEQAFGDRVSARLAAAGMPGKHYVIDTSRNGNGPGPNTGGFCNLPGLALGANPTSVTRHPLNDAFLWVKYPGESDGACSGNGTPDASAPPSGVFWPAYAMRLVNNRAALLSGAPVR
ncbi:glycoside hydrolase family 6 protein [Nakamurella sp. PAMC28650]|uniref:glycoside hydrolase family 6 protein n=1 Tax=Nakamurella sp. PAMC28650 TaxID=2762325 RepID=UPI00164CF484|nr:glycoside hydrolase family 6 protein [Nakamurella sp. PAMC28650]QNK81791.1 glycoside hydrolase family 6 protein [Nakamurella sp. PAMC28650]